ncbi:MAG: 3'(2'),5'-bisphosphate nucleotidase CysQ [Xanthomonadales bacterium]|nr:3'(2'),5'-bisphosphate nucleotidase CysQ [Gammaproteobacteria bacterium]NNE04255.1 3'(2'),5'-bisphosphate nucleotidase CysQ [Xanthomonadales bacterium]NNL94845.1 3'(2'),5'-bisphosphate nucleotidase CysQ [Xanthomonadales bacterium]
MSQSDDPELISALIRIAAEAGDKILDVYGHDFDVAHKQDQSPLTEADLRSHRYICSALAELAPDTPVMSEESTGIDWEQRRRWPSYFLVDPLDGTREFVKRNGEFTVNIALIENHRPTAGIVHVPVSGECYAGSATLGSFKIVKGRRRPIRVRVPAATPLVVVGSRSHANPDLAQMLETLGPHQLVGMGSSLKFCLVAEGKADFYPRFGPTSEWDTAAAQAVVEAAGGQVIKLDGSPLDYNRKENILNPEFLVFGDASRDWAGLMGGASR